MTYEWKATAQAPGIAPLAGPARAYTDWWLQVEQSSGAGAALSHKLMGLSTDGKRAVPVASPPQPLCDSGGLAGPLPFAVPPHAAPKASPIASGEISDIGAPELAMLAGQISGDTILLCVVDTDIALCHDRFRDANGKSRVLACWHMDGVHNAAAPGQAGLVPLGREIHRAEIVSAMAQGDEDAAATALGLNPAVGGTYINQTTTAGHGTHVLDIAAGTDPADNSPKAQAMRDRVKVLAVILPPDTVLGASGTFLHPYARLALHWVEQRTHELQAVANGATTLPVVINMSYGMAAGPKDGAQPLHAQIRAMLAGFDGHAWMLMPAGNDNLERISAAIRPDPGGEAAELTWHVTPQDLYSTYAELWVDAPPGDLTLTLTAPGAPSLTLRPDTEATACYSLMKPGNTLPLARIYPLGENLQGKAGYLVCVAPTLSHIPGRAAAPAGAWRIGAQSAAGDQRRITVGLQSERPMAGFGRNCHPAYLDAPGYRLFDDTGDEMDTYSADGQDNEPLTTGAQLRRKGTLNAMAVRSGAKIIGGHNSATQQPMGYSASGDDHDGTGYFPSVSLPASASQALPGLLAAGRCSGGVVRAQGTSFAAALAARHVLNWLLDAPPGAAAATVLVPPSGAKATKIGRGMIDEPVAGRVDRRDPHLS